MKRKRKQIQNYQYKPGGNLLNKQGDKKHCYHYNIIVSSYHSRVWECCEKKMRQKDVYHNFKNIEMSLLTTTTIDMVPS